MTICERFLIDKLGVPDTIGNRHLSLCLFAQPLLKILYPGCRVKGIPVAVGNTNVGKSRLSRYLVPVCLRVPEGTADSHKRGSGYFLEGLRLPNEDFNELTYLCEGYIWVEMDEMPGLTKHSAQWKSWTTAGNRIAREKHGKRPRVYVNRSAIVGTANPGMFLANDPGLASRFLCFDMPMMGLDVEKLVTDNLETCYNGAMRAIDQGFNMFEHVVSNDVLASIYACTSKYMYRDANVDYALDTIVEMAHDPGRPDFPGGGRPDLIDEGLVMTKMLYYLTTTRPELKGQTNTIALGRAMATDERFARSHDRAPWRVIRGSEIKGTTAMERKGVVDDLVKSVNAVDEQDIASFL